ncbi:MAG: OmpH family outer membrane protein [Terriglobales bacterium]
MTSKLARFLPTVTFTTIVFSIAALGQTGDAAALPAAPSSAGSTVAGGTGSKLGTINIEQAIFASNEGQRDFQVLSKKLEPKQTELKGQNDEVESLKKQLSAQGDKLNDDARGTLVKQIEQKQKSLERAVQDARDDAQSQQNDIAQRILQKMAPLIGKYAADNGFGVIVDTSSQWPNGPVFWQNGSVDITRAVVDAYNAQSGIAPPPRPAGATGKPTGAPSRPAAKKPAPPK